jgi:mannose-6-phosphate isomerase-like protein (cupin superfamily)
MHRRSFLSLAAGAASAAAFGQSTPAPRSSSLHPVPSGQDRLEEVHNFGITKIAFKVLTQDSHGDLFTIEHAFHQKGGPPRHRHLHQDEWFYVLEGVFLFEVGTERLTLRPGDSVLGPRNLPHAFAFTGNGPGKLLITFTPAGKMEAFFRRVGKTNTMVTQDAALFREFDMQLVGPPLAV